eukprot:PhM_4_TR3074/c1_g2_i7/m.102405
MLSSHHKKIGLLLTIAVLFIFVDFDSLQNQFNGKRPSNSQQEEHLHAATNGIDSIINYSYTQPIYTTANFGFIRRRPIRIDSNLSRDLEHTCDTTPCPYARPIDVMGVEDPWRRTARVCTGHDMYREARPGTWYYDGEPPRGVAANASFVMDRPMLYVPSSGCRVRRLQPSALHTCLRARHGTVAFIGDSHLRDIFQELMHTLGWNDFVRQLSARRHQHNLFDRDGIRFMFNIHINDDTSRAEDIREIPNITHLFLTLGVWAISDSKQSFADMYSTYYRRLKRILTIVSEARARNADATLPPLKVTYMAIRHVYAVSDQSWEHDWLIWIWTLSQSGDRIAVFRKLQLCVVRRVMRELGVAYDVIDFRRSMTNTTL